MKKAIIYFEDNMEKGVKAQLDSLLTTNIIKSWRIEICEDSLECLLIPGTR